MYSNVPYVDGSLACAPSHANPSLAGCLDAKDAELSQRAGSHHYMFTVVSGTKPSQAQATPRSQVAISAAIVVLLLGLFIGAAWITLAGERIAYTQAMADTPTQTIRVSSGDSLWSIAEAHGIDNLDTRQTIEVIRAWNDLDSSMLKPGMELTVPAIDS